MVVEDVVFIVFNRRGRKAWPYGHDKHGREQNHRKQNVRIRRARNLYTNTGYCRLSADLYPFPNILEDVVRGQRGDGATNAQMQIT